MLQMELLMTQNKLQADDQSINRPINQCLTARPAPFMSVLHSPYLTIKLSHTIMSRSLFLSSHPRTSGSLLFKTILRPGADRTPLCFDFPPIIQSDWNSILPYLLHIVELSQCRLQDAERVSMELLDYGAGEWHPFFIYFLMPAAASRFQPLTNKGWIVHAAEQTKWNRSFHTDSDHSFFFFLLTQHRSWSAE